MELLGWNRVSVIVARFLVWWWTAGRKTAVVTFSGVVAEPLLLVEPVCSETQEEQLSKVSREILTDLETSMTTEQVVTQLQQELFTLRAQVAAESGLADAVRAINSLTTALLRGREEDFQQWSKKTEHSSLV